MNHPKKSKNKTSLYTYKRLLEKEKNIRVDIVHLRESLLISENQFFYIIYHQIKFIIDDLVALFGKENEMKKQLKKKLSLKEKITLLKHDIYKLTLYKKKLIRLQNSPFQLLIYFINTTAFIFTYVPQKIRELRIEIELHHKVKKQNLKTFDIVNFGVIPYHYRKLRQQHLVEDLARRGNRVFYIENRFNKRSQSKKRFTITKEQNNVFIVKLYAQKDIGIYHQQPSKSEIRSIISSFNHFSKSVSLINPVIKIDHPFWTYLQSVLSKYPVIYDCMDNYGGFDITGEHIHKLEKKLIHTSNLTISCSKLLMKKVLKSHPLKTKLIRNACDFEHFKDSSVIKDTCSVGLCWINKPVIGFFGAIGEWIDATLLEKIAQNFPRASIVLIGEIQNKEVDAVALRYTNIFPIGEKPYGKLPQYLQTFDLCILPFVVNKHTTLIDPVKMYEYFVSGKPVVTTAVKEIKRYEKVIYYSKSYDSFIRNLHKALKEKSKIIRKKRQDIARLNTWEKRGLDLYKSMKQLVKQYYA